MTFSADAPIAMIGASCRYAGDVDSLDSFWDLLVSGRETVSRVPPDRWDLATEGAGDPDDAAKAAMGCFLSQDPLAYDPAALAVNKEEAPWLDPQHRMLMELVWEACEHAGVPVDGLRGSDTGVFAAMSQNDYLLRTHRPTDQSTSWFSMMGNMHGISVGRVAFLMDWRGPTVAVDTACSSSLVATHLACQSLRLGECDLAVAAGVMLITAPEVHNLTARWLLSPTGRCHAFDQAADGYVRGEGCGAVVLKRLADAERDGDRILAVIRGSAISTDGQTSRMTAPSPVGQRTAFNAALARAGVDPADVGLVEAHAPGTRVGDPVEFESISAVYGQGRGRCALGAVKSSIGHTEPASGLAALLKAALCVNSGYIPPNLHFREWNSSIDPTGTRLFVPTELTPWPVDGGPRLAAVCSYGLGGTNVHLLVEQPPEAPAAGPAAEDDGPRVFLMSASSAGALAPSAGRLADWLTGRRVVPDDLAHTLAVRRSHGPHRLAVVAATGEEAVRRLRSYGDGQVTPGVTEGFAGTRPGAGPVWVFSGQGSQWPGMGASLLDRDAAFTEAIDELEPLIRAEAGISVRDVLASRAEVTRIDHVQPVLFATQVAMARSLCSWGARPAAVIGHSMGEVAAAVVAGALGPADAVTVICRRSAAVRRVAGQGLMASVNLPAAQIRRDLAAAGADEVEIAVLAAPRSAVVGGPPGQVRAMVDRWTRQDVLARLVNVDVASHTAQMEQFLPELRLALAGITPREPGIPLYTTVRPDPRAPGPLDADYWLANQRHPVRLAAAVEAAAADGHRLFLEVAPHPILKHAITETLADTGYADAHVLPTLRRATDDERLALATQVAATHCLGHPVDWRRRYGAGELVDPPPTTWERTRWAARTYPVRHPGQPGLERNALLGVHAPDPEDPGRHLWRATLGTGPLPWLADHRVSGVPVLPAAAVCEMALAACADLYGDGPVEITDVELRAVLPLTAEVEVNALVRGEGRWTLGTGAGDRRVVHAAATLSACAEPARPPAADIHAYLTGRGGDVEPGEFYATCRQRFGLDYGPVFRPLFRIQTEEGRRAALGHLRLDDAATVGARHLRWHPVLLDGCAQTVLACWLGATEIADGAILPVGIRAIRVFGRTRDARYCHTVLESFDERSCTASFRLLDGAGTVLAEVEGFQVRHVERELGAEEFADRLLEVRWEPEPAGGAVSGDAPAVVHRPDDHPAGGVDAARAAAEGLIDVIRASAAAPGPPPRIWVVTRSAVPVLPGESPNLTHAGLRGLVRTAAYEHPELRVTLLDVDDATGPSRIDEEIAAAAPADEIALRDGVRYTARLGRALPPVRTAAPEGDGAYIVTGGLGGLGLVTAGRLAERGAGAVVLNGRTAPGPEALRAVEAMRALGARVEVVPGDIAALGVAERLVAAATAHGHRLRGVVHAAAVIADATLGRTGPGLVERVWRAKVAGAWRLHHATLGHELDFWVGFSSLAGLVGSPGQGAYAAANAWLEAFAAWRRAQGLPGAAISWGAWRGVGRGVGLAAAGHSMISPAEGAAAFERLLTPDAPVTGYDRHNVPVLLAGYPDAARRPFFATARVQARDTPPDLLDELRAIESGHGRLMAVQARVAAEAADILGVAGRLDPHGSLVLLGLDSLLAVRLNHRIRTAVRLDIPTGALWVRPTVASLAEYVLERLGMAAHPGEEPK
ncbi:SDR family NAD(P)-dependent oxidoreductase [Herbidospora sp. NEAU-GS84]|uniref:SDR family NAD(P)-dependent oxidoreductase n=1 Tax=Herbidospora solisilvae TaxID=2696284 RepID=A0A7C9JA84_9ACTN|nr:type I polyketide synthase [Herbidospora solisilvae]NAS20741.1 SDR family NAD(P)-dependent oxidoreductase [Herbidospora solisilvae]